MKGFGTVVTGTLVSGRLQTEQELVVLPQQRDTRVRGLQVHGRSQTSAEAGRRVAVNLGGVDVSDVARGHTLADRGAFEPTRRLDARLDLLPEARPSAPGRARAFPLRHGGASRTRLADRTAGGPRRAPDAAALVANPRELYARIHLESPAVVTRGDRFIIRAYSPLRHIGGGVVLDPRPPVPEFAVPQASSGFGGWTRRVEMRQRRSRCSSTRPGGPDFRGRPSSAAPGSRTWTADRAAERMIGRGAATPVEDLLVSPRVRSRARRAADRGAPGAPRGGAAVRRHASRGGARAAVPAGRPRRLRRGRAGSRRRSPARRPRPSRARGAPACRCRRRRRGCRACSNASTGTRS